MCMGAILEVMPAIFCQQRFPSTKAVRSDMFMRASSNCPRWRTFLLWRNMCPKAPGHAPSIGTPWAIFVDTALFTLDEDPMSIREASLHPVGLNPPFKVGPIRIGPLGDVRVLSRLPEDASPLLTFRGLESGFPEGAARTRSGDALRDEVGV